ncbi:hypothetical protein ACHAWF_014301 [Thalassiosira exigua]
MNRMKNISALLLLFMTCISFSYGQRRKLYYEGRWQSSADGWGEGPPPWHEGPPTWQQARPPPWQAPTAEWQAPTTSKPTTEEHDRFSGIDHASGHQIRKKSVETDTTAKVKWKFDVGFTKMEYQIDVLYGNSVTKLDFHCAQSGQNGPIVVNFWHNDYGKHFNGLAKEGKIYNRDIMCSEQGQDFCHCDGLEVNNLVSLYNAMRNGSIYLNVHTKANPAGEVRGQIFTK